jgi:putative transposase
VPLAVAEVVRQHRAANIWTLCASLDNAVESTQASECWVALEEELVLVQLVIGQAGNIQDDQGSLVHGCCIHRRVKNGVAISMDGKGAWRDDVLVERPRRSVKYEEAHLKAYDTASGAGASIGCRLDFYNSRRPHSNLDNNTPNHACSDAETVFRQPSPVSVNKML